MKVLDFTVRSNIALNNRNHLIKISPANEEILPEMFPGQFVQILVDSSPRVFLRRPISINLVDIEKNEIWLLIQKAGEGTGKICETKPGGTINMIYFGKLIYHALEERAISACRWRGGRYGTTAFF